MGYLERNQRLLAEIQAGVPLKRGMVLTENYEKTRFTTLGSYRSSYLESEVYLGLKEFQNPRQNHREINIRTAGELVVIQALADARPDLLPQLPLLHGLLLDEKGQPTGIITEDFSEGGKNELTFERDYEDLEELLEISGRFHIDVDHIAFRVNGVRRLGDFWGVGFREKRDQELYLQFDSELVKYSVRLNTSL